MSLSIILVIVVLAVAAGSVALSPGLTHRQFPWRIALVRHPMGPELSPLSPRRREESVLLLTAVQELFVEDPARALGHAAALVEATMDEMGYPSKGRPQALAAYHRAQVQGYREARRVLARSKSQQVPTEELRTALVAVRDLYLELVRFGTEDGGPSSAASAPASVRRRPAHAIPRQAVR
ncbi:hypothetical protein C7C46_18880 [Streptomyces tateyamensis]|uniref:Uncharacterized protein n=1 Tax=Streptomyces tateyamensis TaxID=565073 RepID=A0A2V4N3R5_9ACTN|nr:hypothetical protein [Streptomyces tateyamensis]PYC77412.1 hypothetical protein C7C46_18880 [Streptomyces tateyamensis]